MPAHFLLADNEYLDSTYDGQLIPKADSATKTDRQCSALGPYTFLKGSAATRHPEPVISSLAKYAMFARM